MKSIIVILSMLFPVSIKDSPKSLKILKKPKVSYGKYCDMVITVNGVTKEFGCRLDTTYHFELPEKIGEYQ